MTIALFCRWCTSLNCLHIPPPTKSKGYYVFIAYMRNTLFCFYILTSQSSWSYKGSAHIPFTVAMLTFSHVFMGLDTTWTLCSWSLFLVHPRVLQTFRVACSAPFSGRHIGLTKSVISTGSSSRTNASILPSTGERTIPTIRLSCCQGVVLCMRTVPNLAVHSAFGCPCKYVVIV